MKTLYKKCDKCDGRGYFPYRNQNNYYPAYPTIPIGEIISPIVTSLNGNICGWCNGTGREVIGWIEDN